MQNLNIVEKNFNQNGFVIIKNLINEKEIDEILDDIENIKNKFSKIKNRNMHLTADGKFNTIHNINKFIKSGKVLSLSRDKRLIKIVQKILGKKIILRNLEFFLKPRKTGFKAPIHQDNFYWNIPSKKAINVWIACTPSNFKNGGLYYYKKSHKDGLMQHEISFQPGTSLQIQPKELKKKNYSKFYPSLKPGDCILHHCEVAHGSNANKSNKDRVGVVLSFKNINAKVDKVGWNSYQKQLKKNLKALKKNK